MKPFNIQEKIDTLIYSTYAENLFSVLYAAHTLLAVSKLSDKVAGDPPF